MSDCERIADELAMTGITVTLNSCKEPAVEGVVDAIRLLGKRVIEAEAACIVAGRREERAEWVAKCMEQDGAHWQRLTHEARAALESMTTFRDNAAHRETMALRERDEARAEVASLKRDLKKKLRATSRPS